MTAPLRAITLQQPWAGAIAVDGKDIENRTRNIVGQRRGAVAIHAGKAWDLDGQATFWRITGRDELDATHQVQGAVLAVANVVNVHAPGCACRSPWAMPGQWHIKLMDVRVLHRPVPCRGALGLWVLPAAVDVEVLAQLAEAVPA